MRKVILVILVAAFALNASGCIHRQLTIKSDPPGALVYFNEEEIGETPVEFDFVYYDDHKVELVKEGYEKLKTMELIKCPPYLWIPFDLIAEISPVRVEDYRELSYELIPEKQEEIPTQ